MKPYMLHFFAIAVVQNLSGSRGRLILALLRGFTIVRLVMPNMIIVVVTFCVIITHTINLN